MKTVSVLDSTDFNSSTVSGRTKPPVAAALLTSIRAAFADVRNAAAQRRLRNELAHMDESMLRDIGVAEDEIYLVRAGQVFTPRAWAAKADARAWSA